MLRTGAKFIVDAGSAGSVFQVVRPGVCPFSPFDQAFIDIQNSIIVVIDVDRIFDTITVGIDGQNVIAIVEIDSSWCCVASISSRVVI